MFDDFLKELKLALQAQNIYYVQPILNEYTKKFEMLQASGKSEFECVIALGDPDEIAHTLVGQDYTVQDKIERNMIDGNVSPSAKSTDKEPTTPAKLPTKGGIICTDIFYMTPITIVAALGIIALAFLSALVGFAGASYCIMAWTTFSVLKEQIFCFVIALCGVLMFTGGMIVTLKLIVTICEGIKDYRVERAEKLSLIASTRGNND